MFCWAALRSDLFIFLQEFFWKFSLLRFFLPSSFLPSDFDVSTKVGVGRIWMFKDTVDGPFLALPPSQALGSARVPVSPKDKGQGFSSPVPQMPTFWSFCSAAQEGSQAEASGPKVYPGGPRLCHTFPIYYSKKGLWVCKLYTSENSQEAG